VGTVVQAVELAVRAAEVAVGVAGVQAVDVAQAFDAGSGEFGGGGLDAVGPEAKTTPSVKP
jgi:hypothetical protein